jgi:hypothetical protein
VLNAVLECYRKKEEEKNLFTPAVPTNKIEKPEMMDDTSSEIGNRTFIANNR